MLQLKGFSAQQRARPAPEIIDATHPRGIPGQRAQLVSIALDHALGTYVLRGPFNLLPWKGQTVRVQVYAANDGSYATTFRVDDVSLK